MTNHVFSVKGIEMSRNMVFVVALILQCSFLASQTVDVEILDSVIEPSDTGSPGSFGIQVDRSGNWLVVGDQKPRFYVFAKSGGSWVEHSIISPEDTSMASFSVKVDGNHIAYANDDKIYTYRYSSGTWVPTGPIDDSFFSVSNIDLSQELMVALPTRYDGYTFESTLDLYQFVGGSWVLVDQSSLDFEYWNIGQVSLSEGTCAIGLNDSGTNETSVKVLRRSGSSWLTEASFTGKGYNPTLDGNFLFLSIGGVDSDIRVEVYEKEQSSWNYKATLRPSSIDNPTWSYRGPKVVEINGIVVLSLVWDSRLFFFAENDGSWQEVAVLDGPPVPFDTDGDGAAFGAAMASDGDRLLVGAMDHFVQTGPSSWVERGGVYQVSLQAGADPDPCLDKVSEIDLLDNRFRISGAAFLNNNPSTFFLQNLCTDTTVSNTAAAFYFNDNNDPVQEGFVSVRNICNGGAQAYVVEVASASTRRFWIDVEDTQPASSTATRTRLEDSHRSSRPVPTPSPAHARRML